MGNPAAAVFGPVIALMLFFNLFARLNLYVGPLGSRPLCNPLC